MPEETPGLMERIIARLRAKPEESIEERAAKAKVKLTGAVKAISDPNVPGTIQKRQRLYEDVYQKTKDE